MLRRRFLSITSWFYHPDLGMKDFEVLSRASAFAIQRSDGRSDASPHIITSQHVTHPFRFPHYYPQDTHEWLAHLTPEHIKCTLELREVSDANQHRPAFTFVC
jgi:hypothetical protein